MRVSFVVPCYQEEESLARLAPVLPSLAADEVVLVDDGSTDGTASALRAMAAADPRVRVETHARNRGVGAAMRTGFATASGDVVVAYDADMTYPASDAARLVAEVVAGADVASASPFLEGGGVTVSVGPFRRFLSGAASFAYRRVLGRRARGVRTFTCAFRAYRTAALRGAAFRSDGFPAAAELLGRLLLSGARVVEVPSRLSARVAGRSKMRVLRAALGHARVLARLAGLRARSAFRRRPEGLAVTAP